MKFHFLLFFLVFLKTTSAQGCSSQDCSCADVTYGNCIAPPIAQRLHVGSMEQCIQNCDLFGSFGKCNYLLYWEADYIHYNCELIDHNVLDQYLDYCQVIGQPLRDFYGNCVEIVDSCSLIGCDSCHSCWADDACGLYAQTKCHKFGSQGESFKYIPYFEYCLSLCTNQQQTNPWTYAVYDKEQQECICHSDGWKPWIDCQLTAVPFGMSLAQVEQCTQRNM